MYWELLKESYAEWSRHNATVLAAALAFYTTFSFSPMLIIAIAIAGFVLGKATVQLYILEQIHYYLGAEGAALIRVMIERGYTPGSNIPATIIGILLILLGATTVLVMLRDVLDTIWGVAPDPNISIRDWLKARLISLLVIIGIGFLLLFAMAMSIGMATLSDNISFLLNVPVSLLHAINLLISLGFITMIFALIYKFLPDAEIPWRHVIIGSIIGGLLFLLGSFPVGLYLTRSSPGSAYGAAGSLTVFLLWVYYESLIFIFGAAITRVNAKKSKTAVEPKKHAVLTEQASKGYVREWNRGGKG
jgi:membrane protein